jgi:hypothetical protein
MFIIALFKQLVYSCAILCIFAFCVIPLHAQFIFLQNTNEEQE